MNWNIFCLKYDKREPWAFEQLSYLLFCAEFDNRIGLFRYKNQQGIETEPIEKDGKFYGFQSKYYTTSLAKNKKDIIDSIQKAKSKNKQLNVLYLYTNQEFSESTNTNQKKPEYQLQIEQVANNEGLEIVWRVPSHLEQQLSLVENSSIYKTFFSRDPNEGDLINEISRRNENILEKIQTEILFKNKTIKIDRSSDIEAIANHLHEKKNIIISGEGGCGKTAIFKEYYTSYSKKIPICFFKASELNVSHINRIFEFEHAFTFVDFLNAYKDEPLKIFVIDSAENLAEISNKDILNTLIQELKKNAWNIIFTTRSTYLNHLRFEIEENHQLAIFVNDISLISIDKLKSIADEFQFSLPQNKKFLERLTNLFYLREYVKLYSNITQQGNYNDFINLLWKKRVQGTDLKDNLHLDREKCIISIAKERCKKLRFYINADSLSPKALFPLKQDEILGYDEKHNGYFFTHDIYEEWTLDKIVSRSFLNFPDPQELFNELGDSLLIRRAFKLWLSDHFYESPKELESFIQKAFANIEVKEFWKDEILISVLLSDYSKEFFNFFENQIIENDFKTLKKILFLLRIACTDISEVQNTSKITKPKGKGWEEIIFLIHKHRANFFENNLKLVLPILVDWCNFNKKGETTKYAGLLALSLLQKAETDKNFYLKDSIEEKILMVVFNAAFEIKKELKEIFEKVVSNKWTDNNDPYEELCSKIIEKPIEAIELINTLPLSIIQLCDLFWQKQQYKHEVSIYDRVSMEEQYGLTDKFEFNYSTASAHQTPIIFLLQKTFYETINFIIAFTNRAVETYSNSDIGQKDVIKVTLKIGEKEVTQYLSNAIWCMYRGSGSPNVPNILQSIHMALEKILLEYAKTSNSDLIQEYFLFILYKSKSTSLTSVVCSVILANPNKFYDIALILFKTKELFHFDTLRIINEHQVKLLYLFGYGMDKIDDVLYRDERLKTCEDKHRNSNLESLFLNYQYTGVKDFTDEQNTEFIKKLYKIIDQHKSNPSANNYGILLERMDRRNLELNTIHNEDNILRIELRPKELSDELKKKSEEGLNQIQHFTEYSSLREWANFLGGTTNKTKNLKQEEYDKNPHLVLSDTKKLIEMLNLEQNSRNPFDYSTPAYTCSKLIINHKDILSIEDKAFCKEIIHSYLSNIFADNYYFQIGDGIEASIHAIPSLLNEYPEEVEYYISIIVFALLDESSIGDNKRISDYVFEIIHISKLWEHNSKIAQSILFSYVKLKPIYKIIITQKKIEMGWRLISKTSILEELEKSNIDFIIENISFNIEEIASLDIQGFEVILQLIPFDTKDKILLEIYLKSLSLFAPQLLKDKESYKENLEDVRNIYTLRINIFKLYACFILHRDKTEIDIFLEPFLKSFLSTEEATLFIEEIVIAEDILKNYEKFWYIWDSLFVKIKELSINPQDYHLKKIIQNYLLSYNWWREGIEEWHSLKSDNLFLYTNASKELGNIPAVLYSISRVLNTIGSNFKDEGIDWIYTIVSNNLSLQLGDLESNTIYYLEKFLRKFTFINKQKIKKDLRLKNKVIPILDFMIERGSEYAYLLRESIL